jgi:hypothetical protein
MLPNAEKIALPCTVLFVLFDDASVFVCGVIDAAVHFHMYHYCYFVFDLLLKAFSLVSLPLLCANYCNEFLLSLWSCIVTFPLYHYR